MVMLVFIYSKLKVDDIVYMWVESNVLYLKGFWNHFIVFKSDCGWEIKGKNNLKLTNK